MPSIRVYVRPDVALGMDTQTSRRLLLELRIRVAAGLRLDTKMVEALMLNVNHCVNLPPISIDIMYSVRPGLEPKETTREQLVHDVAAMVASFDWLPGAVDGIAVWVLPQNGAKFGLVEREVT